MMLLTLGLIFRINGVFMNITGGCHCGELQYTATIDPQKVFICHCMDCQKLSTSAFRVVVKSAINGLTFTKGQPKEYIKIAASGNRRAQGFCQNCGSQIYASSVDSVDKEYSIRAGSSDQREQLIPLSQTWMNSSQAWVQQIASMPSFPESIPQ